MNKTERFQVRIPTKGKKAEIIHTEHRDESAARRSLESTRHRHPSAFLWDGQTRQRLA
jgi:hypothetical protein